MKTIFYAFGALLLVSAVTVLYKTTAAADSRVSSVTVSHRPELEYLKAVNSVAPPQDPQLLFLLMAEYANANRQGEGAEFFTARLKEFEPRLADSQKALYLSAIGLLRAQHASSVSLIHRVGYVKETIGILDQAKQLSGGKIFVVNWIAGIVHSELPGVFQIAQAVYDPHFPAGTKNPVFTVSSRSRMNGLSRYPKYNLSIVRVNHFA
jgi:hypothetical protein